MSTKPIYFDAHTHANLAAYRDDHREVVARALALGVGMVNVGTQKETSRRAVELAREFGDEPVYAAVGLHPVHTGVSFHDEQELGGGDAARAFTGRGETFDPAAYRELAEDPKVVAIGECGLDYFHLPEGQEEEAKQKQRDAFLAQVAFAKEVGKPLMVHCRSGIPERASPDGADRDAYGDLLDLLKTNNYQPVTPSIIHFFAGTIDEAERFLDLGFSFTFGGAITFPPRKGGVDYAAVVRVLPMERIMSETDAPYVAPVPYRGKRNEPAYVVEVVRKLAELKGVSVEEMARATTENARRVFGLV